MATRKVLGLFTDYFGLVMFGNANAYSLRGNVVRGRRSGGTWRLDQSTGLGVEGISVEQLLHFGADVSFHTATKCFVQIRISWTAPDYLVISVVSGWCYWTC